MADINSLNSAFSTANATSTSGTLPSGSTPTGKTPKKELDQADFMKMLTMQLSYQDPFKPVDNSQMIAQMSSMATTDGINRLNTAIGGLNSVMTSSQALQASSLVGQQVLVPSDTGYLQEGGAINGVIAVGDHASNLKVTIKNESGQVVREIGMAGEHKGNVDFAWDGKDKDGKALPAGKYQVTVSGTVNNKVETFPALTYAKVDSVTLGNANNPTLVNLKGLGPIRLTDILQISGNSSGTPTTPPESNNGSSRTL
ncbi:flagellar hook assembly protein FlgD [Aeromonas schubertii]|uniref:Basal-body rod modification protein FlgD n=2 Tax=Aeromonas schubertii TaxID=652 RepID=A0ABS7V7T0_9GAMM|nr:flagellar hook assembly protein FlgD [Aeromonas schubertii]KUE81697.1 flagellar biosynthesis protein FlgD [Aeromonas schubertii]MBZ6065122.1 flagellar hook assembly protein FlgD [Aeromonas schubertii]MBZ6071623.1 flagellar hook assembly protein FlgD [Aeromonas schubertii]QCG48664.1 flagellar hook assembly protein FlgD [Aeromonas schubertii]